MRATCYVLFSKKLNKFYVGATHDNVEHRQEKHNKHRYGNHRFTAKAMDWKVFLTFQANDYSHAIRMERKIKSMKSKTYIRNLKQYPELRQKLITQTIT